MAGFKKKVLVDYDEYSNLKTSKKADNHEKSEKDVNSLEKLKRERRKLLSNKSIDNREKVLIDSYLMSNAHRDEFSKSSKTYNKEDFEEVDDGGLGQVKRDRRRLYDSKSIDDREKVMIDSYLMNNAHRIRTENKLKNDKLDLLIKRLGNQKTNNRLNGITPIPRQLTSTPYESHNDDSLEGDIDLPSLPTTTNNSLMIDPDVDMSRIPQEFYDRYLEPDLSVTSFKSMQNEGEGDNDEEEIVDPDVQQDYYSYLLPQIDHEGNSTIPKVLISKRKLLEQNLNDLEMRKRVLLNADADLDNEAMRDVSKNVEIPKSTNEHKKKQVEKLKKYLKYPLKINDMRDLQKYTTIGSDIPSTSTDVQKETQPISEKELVQLRKNPDKMRAYEMMLDLTKRKRAAKPILWKNKKLKEAIDEIPRQKLDLKDHKVREKLRLREQSVKVRARENSEQQHQEKIKFMKELNIVPQIINSKWIERGTLRRKRMKNQSMPKKQMKGMKKKRKRVTRHRN